MAKQKSSLRDFVSAAFWLLIIHSIFPCLHSAESSNNPSNCIESEREALLTFKAGLSDPTNILSSWEGEECCTWWGVSCSNKTGHVVELNLRRTEDEILLYHSWLGGEINQSLLHLKHLCRLDLSVNNFSGSIPEFIGSFGNLRYLNLSVASFVGLIPPQLGNLSRLHYLDLSAIPFEYYLDFDYKSAKLLYEFNENHGKLYVDNLSWLPHLSSLKYLDMFSVKLTRAKNWLKMVNMLSSLTTLKLANCQLDTFSSSLSYLNFTSLNTLDLSYNNINSTLPQWLWNLTSLTYLDLSENSFHGPIPDAVGNLVSLEVLRLYSNILDGMIPSTITNLSSLNTVYLSGNSIRGLVDSLCNSTPPRLQFLGLSNNLLSGKLSSGIVQMRSLEELDLSDNPLDGPIPVEIGKLHQLTLLDLSNNSFNGVVTEAYFENLTNLDSLDLSMNSLAISVDGSWVPPFQLRTIEVESCNLGPFFPSWIQHQVEVVTLDFSNCGISGAVPEWFWKKVAPSIAYLDLSYNQISGRLPKSLQIRNWSTIYLSSNHFEGSLPPGLLFNALNLDLSNNSFSGPLPNVEMPHLESIHLSHNHFNSSIPSSFCKNGYYLDISNNDLSGEIPDEWQTRSPMFIILANNHLSGRIPISIGLITSLQALILRSNNMSGFIPRSLRTNKKLTFLDLSGNYFFGSIPSWLGENFTYLSFLSLRSNLFSGNIPMQVVQLHKLKILDLADNNLSELIPQFLGNFSSMSTVQEQNEYAVFYDSGIIAEDQVGYFISWLAFTKATRLQYTKNLYLVKSIDLSDNSLTGEIPEEIGALIGLTNLNLSGNCLNGNIPETIGKLQSLESLDLSRNELSGIIPLSISNLTSLSYLNLSYNNLSGKIPSGHQLQTLIDPSIYAGNDDLCGPPLTKNCSSNKAYEGGIGKYDDKAYDEQIWIYYSIGVGYIVGLWALCGVLLFKKIWRYAYFQFVDNMYDHLYVGVCFSLAKLKRAWIGRN